MNVYLPSNYKLTQSILQCKFPSHYKPLHKYAPQKGAFEKCAKLQGLLSEFLH